MNNITVYTRNEPYCFYCDEAKKMLKYYGVKYKNIVIGEDISKLLSDDLDNEKVVNEVSVDVNEEKNKSLANENNNSSPSKSKIDLL